MNKYLKSEYKPILIGIFAYSILYAANVLYGHFLIQTEIIKVDATNESWNGHPLLIFSDIISTLILVVPGFLAGWFSTGKGIINGIFVVALCCIATFFLFSLNYAIFHVDLYLLFLLIQTLIMPVTVGAISGAAGQFQKNKKTHL
jgi:hypothetical protein